ncbi:MAG: hypothetical protein MI757_07180 [Pirellulales bacterium]|nr:hypothetical protein [Pirellulales bacterium]
MILVSQLVSIVVVTALGTLFVAETWREAEGPGVTTGAWVVAGMVAVVCLGFVVSVGRSMVELWWTPPSPRD